MKRFLLFPVLSCLLLAACDDKVVPTQEASYAQEGTFAVTCPNHLSGKPAFKELLTGLRKAAANKDAEYIRNLVDDKIKYDFGGGEGKAGFLKKWELDGNAKNSPFWAELNEILRLGGYSESSDTVIFPCTFLQPAPENWLYKRAPQFSAFDYLVAVHGGALLTDSQGKTSRPLQFGETLLIKDGQERTVVTYDGFVGNAQAADVRSPVDHRMFIQRVGDEWKMTLFIAGD